VPVIKKLNLVPTGAVDGEEENSTIEAGFRAPAGGSKDGRKEGVAGKVPVE